MTNTTLNDDVMHSRFSRQRDGRRRQRYDGRRRRMRHIDQHFRFCDALAVADVIVVVNLHQRLFLHFLLLHLMLLDGCHAGSG